MTDGWLVGESVGTLISAGVLVGGAVVAGFYGRKANPSVEAVAHYQPSGAIVLQVCATIAAPGVLPIRIAKAESKHGPTITVTEALIGSAGQLRDGAVYQERTFVGEDQIGGGETVSKTELFPLPRPTEDLAGWRVSFYVDIPRFLAEHRGWWTWAANTFAPVPSGEGAGHRVLGASALAPPALPAFSEPEAMPPDGSPNGPSSA